MNREWMDQAACKDMNPDLFAPASRPSAENTRRIEEAKKVCKTCLVAAECLAYALSSTEHGVWGGTDDAERKRIKRRGLSARS